jgi:ribonuclease D
MGIVTSSSKISREEVNALEIRRWEGEIVLVESPAELERALADIRADSVVGFDTETRPAFKVGQWYPPSLAQFATANAVYLFRLPVMEKPVAEILASETTKAGVSVSDDLKALKKVFPFEEKNVVDVGTAAKRAGLQQSGVRNLAAMLLGFRIPKGAKTTNWAAQRLTPQQIAYAATDAWACRELYLELRKRGQDPFSVKGS